MYDNDIENTGFETEELPLRSSTREETDKKCDNCGGVCDYDPAMQKLVCAYCGNTVDIEDHEDSEKRVLEADLFGEEVTGSFDWGAEKKTIICNSCGAESLYDVLDLANECPYCGSNQVMEEKGVDTLAPGGVCVFKIPQPQAAENFRTWIKKRFYCPRDVKNHVRPDDFKGVYLPYWTFDADTHTKYEGEYGIETSHTDSKGNTTTTTRWRKTSGEYYAFIDDMPVVATKRYDAKALRQIEPFDTADNKLYKPEYLSGFVSERYSFGLKEGWEKGKELIKEKLKVDIANHIIKKHKADKGVVNHMETVHSNVKYKYLMLPIWLSSFQHKGKTYQFMVNGQTGKVSGKTPVSAIKVILTILAILAAIILIIALFSGEDVEFNITF